MEILTTIISIAVLLLILQTIYKVFRWFRRLIRKALVKKQPKEDNRYCVLKITEDGELTHFKFDDEKSARSSYSTLLNFSEHDGSFIALFERAVMIDTNDERGKLE